MKHLTKELIINEFEKMDINFDPSDGMNGYVDDTFSSVYEAIKNIIDELKC